MATESSSVLLRGEITPVVSNMITNPIIFNRAAAASSSSSLSLSLSLRCWSISSSSSSLWRGRPPTRFRIRRRRQSCPTWGCGRTTTSFLLAPPPPTKTRLLALLHYGDITRSGSSSNEDDDEQDMLDMMMDEIEMNDDMLILDTPGRGGGIQRYSMVELPDSMVNTTIFVGNICEFVHDDDLSKLFTESCSSTSFHLPASVVRKPDTTSLRYGFVSFPNQSDQQNAISLYNGYVWRGYKLRVEPIRIDDNDKKKKGRRGRVRIPERLASYVVGDISRHRTMMSTSSSSSKRKRSTRQSTTRRYHSSSSSSNIDNNVEVDSEIDDDDTSTTSKKMMKKEKKKMMKNERKQQQIRRISRDDVERLSRGQPSKRKGYGSRAVPHRLNVEEREEYERSLKRGYLTLSGYGNRRSRKGSPLSNIHRQWCDSRNKPRIVLLKSTTGQRVQRADGQIEDIVIVDLSPLRLPAVVYASSRTTTSSNDSTNTNSSPTTTGTSNNTTMNIIMMMQQQQQQWLDDINREAVNAGMRPTTSKKDDDDDDDDEDHDDRNGDVNNDNNMMVEDEDVEDEDEEEEEEEKVIDMTTTTTTATMDNMFVDINSWFTEPIWKLPQVIIASYRGERSNSKKMAKTLAILWNIPDQTSSSSSSSSRSRDYYDDDHDRTGGAKNRRTAGAKRGGRTKTKTLGEHRKRRERGGGHRQAWMM